MNRTSALLLIVVAAAGSGCATPVAPLPRNLEEYARLQATDPNAYPRHTLVLSNLRRVLDSDLPTPDRMASLKLLTKLGADDPALYQGLAQVLFQPNCPRELHQAAFAYLLGKDYPGLAAYVIQALAQTGQDPALRDSTLDWLMRHPSPEVLAEVVKSWAAEPSPDGLNEPRYRYIIEHITGRKWDEALLAGLNTPQPFARGAALEVLVARSSVESLKRRISQMEPGSEAVAALQSFAEIFDYVPANRAEFAAVTTVFKAHLEVISDAARLESGWREDYGYQFNIRDFHLISRLATDPLRTVPPRKEIISALSQSLSARQHVPYDRRRGEAKTAETDDFQLQVDSLTISDLWNLHLLDEMLSRRRMQMALRMIAERNQADAQSACSGLVFYQHGQGEAILYPPAKPADQTSQGYNVSAQMVTDSRDAMCRFHTHFRKVRNAPEAGPDADELRGARQEGHYGVILTSVDEYSFCAHYYNPNGQVVSLGKFPFLKVTASAPADAPSR